MSSENNAKKVVVTGMGVLTSIGIGVDEYWENLLKGTSGIGRVTRFDPTDYASQVGSEIRDFDASKYMDGKEAKRNDRYTQFAVAASRLAMEDGGLDSKDVDAERFGVLIGSGIGGMETIEQQSKRLFDFGPKKVSPFMIPSLIANMASGIVAIELGAKGPNFSIVSACATATHTIGESLRMLREGRADVMIAGGSEAAITKLGYSGFCAMRAMSTVSNDDPQRSSRPFDANRDGFVMGEGAGVLLLETLEHAQARGARIYCELAGYGATCDAYHITSPDPEGAGLASAYTIAIEDAGVGVDEVDYINAHGTSTPYNDKFETMAIKSVFGDRAKDIPINSTKSMIGHLLGAAGGVEAIVSVKSIQTAKLHPTINYETPDPDCDLDYVPNEVREHEVNVALSDNLGFGGHNAALLFKKHTS